MKKAGLLSILIIFSVFLGDVYAGKKYNIKETPASDSRIEYTGRVHRTDGMVSYDWSGIYFRVKFNGPYLAMKCSDSGSCWFNQWTDKEMSETADRKFKVGAKDTLIVLAEGLGKGEHEVIIQKRTEGDQGSFSILSFLTEGEILQASGRKERHIEFIGDSYTCGYGTEGCSKSDSFKAETENCNLTYAAIAARYFNADFNLISHSGQGICRNYGDHMNGYNMPDRYSQTFDMNRECIWMPEQAPYRPNIVIIYLCTNDFSTGNQPSKERFAERYIELMSKIKNNYGEDIPILCMGSNCSPDIYDYLRYVYTICGMKNVAYTVISRGAHDEDKDLGSDWHPNYNGHLKVASCIIPYISTLTGWEMDMKAYR